MAEKLYGYSASGLFGYSHMYGGYPGGQAEYAGVPFADIGPLKVPDTLTDEQVLFLSGVFPNGYVAADTCQIKLGDTVEVWGCGPVGQFAIKSAHLLGQGTSGARFARCYGSANVNTLGALPCIRSGATRSSAPATPDGPVITATYCLPSAAKLIG